LTFIPLKPHCNERQGSRTRMNTGVSCKRCLGRTPSMRARIQRRHPRQQEKKENITWQLD
jgi:hypothetical protein